MERINRGIKLENYGINDKNIRDIKNLPFIFELGKKIYRENSEYGIWDSYGYKHHIHSEILKECLVILKPLADRMLEESENISTNESTDIKLDPNWESSQTGLEVNISRPSQIIEKKIPKKEELINTKYEFEFALSFAGEDREIVEQIANKLEDKVIKVFYDAFYKAELLGKDLALKFKEIYGEKSEYVVIFVSENYEKKLWTNFEFEIARKAIESKKEDYILPIRLDDTILFGLKETIAYIDFNKEGSKGTVKILCEKLELSDNKYRADQIEEFFSILSELDGYFMKLLDREYAKDIKGIFLYLSKEGLIKTNDYDIFINLKSQQKRAYLKGIVPSVKQIRRDISFLKRLISKMAFVLA